MPYTLPGAFEHVYDVQSGRTTAGEGPWIRSDRAFPRVSRCSGP
ncbi:hypothetical protein L083_0295 [Actinoplanes sp. N902-109]|nr:hypothetical protein L083_0295 [Actinoplanes sp. N902-109]